MFIRAFHNTGKFFSLILGDIIWATLTFLATYAMNQFDILNLNGWIPDWMIPFAYIAVVLGSFILLVFIYNLIKLAFTRNNHLLELQPVNNINKHVVQEPLIGFLYGVGIEIHNESSLEVSECSGVLESLQQVFINSKNKPIYKNINLGITGLSSSGVLRWANKDFQELSCNEVIPAKSKEKTIQVANFISLTEVVKKGKKHQLHQDEAKYFEFSLCGANLKNWRTPGLYKVKIRINGKFLGNAEQQSLVQYFEGYLYSYVNGNLFDVCWVKQPLKNKHILLDPRVLLKQ